MGSLMRKIRQHEEKQELENIKKLYHKKAKIECPKCHRKSLFMTNDKGEIYCIRCDELIAVKEK